MDKASADDCIEAAFPSLTPTLQRGARFIIDNPKAIALHSMRKVAQEAGLPSSAMHRLALQLGFGGYEALRSVYREWLSEGSVTFAQRASALQKRAKGDRTQALVHDLVQADTRNLDQILLPAAVEQLRKAGELLGNARHVYVAALRSLFPAAYYFHYACGMFRRNTTLLSGLGGTFPDDLRRAGPEDALLVFSCEPYARETLLAVQFGHRKGLRIVSVTDSAVSPIAGPASALVVVSNGTPSLFPSVVPAMAVAQILAATLVVRGGASSLRAVRESEAQLREFDIYHQPGKKP